MITTDNLNEAIKQIQKSRKDNPKKKIVVQAHGEEFNRKILENKNVDIFLDPHLHNRKDKLKQRDSGLNEVLCKIAKKNNIKIGIDISKIQKLDRREKAIAISRIMQNIKLCRRINVKIIFYPSKLDKHDALSFILTLKGSTEQGIESIDY